MKLFLVYLMLAGEPVILNNKPVTFHKFTVCVQTAQILNNHYKTDEFYCMTSLPPKSRDL